MRLISPPSLLLLAQHSLAIDLDPNSNESIKSAAKTVAGNVASLYNNHTIPGIIEGPWYWWSSGLAWDSMVNYWAVTGDSTYNAMVAEALLFQTGPQYNYMPPNQTRDLGSDDQATWGLAAMTAAEANFPTAIGNNVTWIQLAENVFNSQAARWDEDTCGGGLRWQLFSFNAGYDYKNAPSTGNFFHLASRLYRFTGNQTYLEWSQKAVDWSKKIGLVTDEGQVYDGTAVQQNCSDINKVQWTATLGAYLAGAAFASNVTRAESWTNLREELMSGSELFLKNGVLTELACAPVMTCNVDSYNFRAVLARAWARSAQLATRSAIAAPVKKSAQAAAATCTGGESRTSCGSDWSSGSFDGKSGLGQELSSLEIILATLPAPVLRTANTSSPSTVNTGSENGTTISTAPDTSNTGNAASIQQPATIAGFGTLLAWALML